MEIVNSKLSEKVLRRKDPGFQIAKHHLVYVCFFTAFVLKSACLSNAQIIPNDFFQYTYPKLQVASGFLLAVELDYKK